MINNIISSKPSISLITPIYNIGDVILETVESVRNQTIQDFEWIIIDDGSDDNHVQIIKAKLLSLDSRIKFITHDFNKGLPAARNTGIAAASAPYLFFLDADDLIDPTFIEKSYLFLSANFEFAFVNSYVIGFGAQSYKWTGGFHDKELFLKENRNTSCFMARREVFDHVLFDEGMRYGCEDWDFWLNAASKGFWGYTIPEFLFSYRRSENNKWSTLEGKDSLGHIQKKLNLKYAPKLQNGFPVADLYKYSFGEPSIDFQLDDARCDDYTARQHVIFIFPWLKVGGADQFNFNLIKGLKEKGWTSTIVTTLGSDHAWEEKFSTVTEDIIHLSNIGTESLYYYFLENIISNRRPKLIFLSNSMYGYYSLPLIKSRFPQIPVVDYVHCEDLGWFGGGYPYFSVLFSDFINATFTTSDQLKNWCVNKGGESEKIQVKYINVDTDYIKRCQETRKKVRGNLGINDSVPLILYVARLTQQKQPIVLAETLDSLIKKNLNFKCIIIGDGPDQDLLLSSLNRINARDHVEYLGSKTNEEVLHYMDAADIFFLPSQYEGIALSIYEAMAKELAVVGAKVGGQAELVTEDSGFLVSPENIEQSIENYSSILERLIENPILVKQLGENARNRVVEDFNLEEMVQNMHQSLLELEPSKPVSAETISKSYFLLLNRVMHLENQNSELWVNSNSKILKVINRYKKPYKRLKRAYSWLRNFVKV